MRYHIILLTIFLFTFSQARTWTDKQGRKIEADITSATETTVTVTRNLKPITLQLDTLSPEDILFVQNWEKSNTSSTSIPTGALTFNNQPLTPGGKMNKYTFPYDEATKKKIEKKFKSKNETYSMAIAVPVGFDPTKPQHVFFPTAACNNEIEKRGGHFRVFPSYVGTCLSNNWVCLTIHDDNGFVTHTEYLTLGLAEIKKNWPAASKWKYAFGGFSGGAKAYSTPFHFAISQKLDVVGAFLAGCNQDYSENSKKAFKNNNSELKDIKIFISTGDADSLVTMEQNEQLRKSMKSNGFRTFKNEFFPGGHSLNQFHFENALKWFAE